MGKSLDFWRGYFSGQNLDLCDIIENAVVVAAFDYPKELMLRRDRIAELLFTCNLKKCLGCDKERNVKCVIDGDDANVSDREAEALNDEIEDESQLIAEVFRIKEILDSHREESDSTLFDSLRRLQLMDLSVDILKETEIGKSVNGLKKHGSEKIRDLVRALIEGWISLLDAWMNATAAIAENTSPESMKTSTVEFEEGLPSPPLDEGAFFAHSVELSGFFDGMDGDGNPTTNGDANNNHGSSRKPPVNDGSVLEQKDQQQQQLSNELFALQEKKVQQTMKQETVTKNKAAVVKPNKPSCGVTGSTRPTGTSTEQKVNNEVMSQLKKDVNAVQKKPLSTPQNNVSHKQREQRSANGAIRKKPLTPQQEIQKVGSSKEASIQVKMEATKRKLQERYQEAENAKKQRTIQVMELHDIPKQGSSSNHLMKPGQYNHKKNGTNKRH